jgi:hypothetical protein
MTGLVRKATLLTVCGLFVAAAAMAGVPSPANSTKSSNCIRYVASKAGPIADPAGLFTVTVKDLVPNPIPNSQVVIDFSGCGDTHAANQASQEPALNLVVDGTNKTVRALTNGSGVATFKIVGGVTASRTPVGATNCAKVYADGVLLSSVSVNAFDQDGVAGVALADLALWAGDLYGGASQQRSNYDCSASAPIVALPDLSIWAVDYYSTQPLSGTGYAW